MNIDKYGKICWQGMESKNYIRSILENGDTDLRGAEWTTIWRFGVSFVQILKFYSY